MARRLRIVHTEWSNGWGGQEIRILEEARAMAERGHWVGICGVPEGQMAQRAPQAGIEFFPLPMAGAWDLRAAAGMWKLLRRVGADILHTHSSVDSWLGGMVARAAGVACVRTRHLSVPVSTKPWNIVYRLPHMVITTGEGIRRHLVEDYGLAPERVVSIPTGVDTIRFCPRPRDENLARELGISPGEKVVGIVAVLRSWKRHDLFCEMARQLLERMKGLRFLIVGGGPGWERVNRYLDDMGLRPWVIMTGHREDVERIIPLMDVGVLASDKAEGVPQAALQYMACAKPVVASAAGDIPQVVRHELTGLLVRPGDAGALAEAVQRLLEDEALAARLAEQGRRLVEQEFSRQKMVEQTERVYEKALREARGA